MENPSNQERQQMSAIAQDTLRLYAARKWPTTNHKGRLAQLCRQLPWSNRRVRAIYNGEQGISLRAEEQAALDALTQEARNEYLDLQSRIARLEALLLHQDEDFHSAQVAALRQGASGRR